MILIAGLGNPGEKFKNTRHNVGFMVIDAFAEKNNFPDFKFSKKFNSLISEEILYGEKITLTKPQTFMNNSGVAVKKILSSTKTTRPGLVVIHDDIDLPLGKIKIVKNRGSAGHKGVQSIIEKLGTNEFIRLRVGILPESGKPKNPEKFVLQKFTKEIMEKAIDKAVNALDLLIKEGVEKAMNEYNK